MTTTTKQITIIGSLNMDLVTVTERMPAGGETMHALSFHTGAGGKGGNQAVACARLSRPTATSPSSIQISMIAAVGSDDFGKSLTQGLASDGIDTSGIQTRPNTTSGIATIIVESRSGENRILLQSGANATLLPSSLPSFVTSDWIILQLEIPLETVLWICENSGESNVILNPAPAIPLPERIYPLLHTLIVNEGEAALLSGRTLAEVEVEGFNWSTIASHFLSLGVKNVIITLGSKGAFIKTTSLEALIPTEKVDKVVDTTAAGDTFVGAYAVQMARLGKDAEMSKEVIVLASRAAGKTIQTAGAQNSIPWAGEVEGFN